MPGITMYDVYLVRFEQIFASLCTEKSTLLARARQLNFPMWIEKSQIKSQLTVSFDLILRYDATVVDFNQSKVRIVRYGKELNPTKLLSECRY